MSSFRLWLESQIFLIAIFLLARRNGDADEEDMDLFSDDSSDEDSEASFTEELLIILRKGLRRPNYK